MLLIWDLHITSKIKTELLDQIRAFVASQPEEKNLVFLGDFVYHFSYDRAALLALFELFLELYAQGKTLYILAGNHDRLGNSFVYEEGKQVFDLLQSHQAEGKLHFITKPRLTELEGEKILFLPFCLELHEEEYSAFELWKTPLTEELLKSKDKNEQFSGKLNQLVNGFIQQEKKLTIVHHYYFNKEKFPGYRSAFTFKDIALAEQLLELPEVSFISGHLHTPFYHKNYLCVGSAWATSPLESNQMKGFFRFSKGEFSFFGTQIVNYFELEPTAVCDEAALIRLSNEIIKQTESLLTASPYYQGMICEYPELDLKKTILTLKVKNLDYEKIDEVLAPELRSQLSDFRLKKTSAKVDDLLLQLEKPDGEALQTFGWWKDLLKAFLHKQYPEEFWKYEEILKKLGVL